LTDEDKTESSPEESPREARRRAKRETRLKARLSRDEDQSPESSEPEAESEGVEPPVPEPAEYSETEPAEIPEAEPVETLPPPRPRRRRRRGRIACLFGMFLGLAGIVAGRLGVLWVHFDVFSQFTLHFGVMLIAFLVGYFMPRARVLTAIVLIILAVIVIGIWPQFASREVTVVGTPTTTERPLRLMSFNTKLSRHNGDAVADEVLRNDPDVAILIEFSQEKRAGLDKLKSRYPYQADCFGIPECYLAIVAKAPFANVQSQSAWEGPPLIRVSFGPELAGLTLIGVHTLRFPHQRAQLRQIEELTRLLDDIQGPRVVAGDFNATPFSRMLSAFSERSRMSRLTYLPTWPAWLKLPQLAIDHVFVGYGIREIEEPRIGRNAGSDHFPVVVGLAVSGP
jgi:endonuclease/exonuclease/phosphatase (EEP) superfamily protein YafD